MSAIALKLKNHAENRREHGFFQEIAKAYRENQAEIICGILGQCGDQAAAVKMYMMLKK